MSDVERPRSQAHDDDKAEVKVPPGDFRMAGDAAAIYDLAKTLMRTAMDQAGIETATWAVLSGITSEMRRRLGPGAAQHIVSGFGGTMQQAATGDFSPAKPGAATLDKLELAFQILAGLHGTVTSEIGADTCIAIGQAIGLADKARSMARRDLQLGEWKSPAS